VPVSDVTPNTPKATMDFSLSPELIALRDRTRRFIADEIIPFETDARLTPHGPAE
jgi:acyl-CoA dehydrogenase